METKEERQQFLKTSFYDAKTRDGTKASDYNLFL